MYLYGSRARGDFREDSDWDFLVVVKDDTPLSIRDQLSCDIFTKALDLNEEVNTVVRTQAQWDANFSLFKINVTNEGIQI